MLGKNMKLKPGAVIDEPGSSAKTKTGEWRTLKPVVDKKKCIKCGLCWLYCPDACIKIKNDGADIDYDYCKGCGICARHCPVKAIKMVREENGKSN